MKGIEFLVNDRGERNAVVIDLALHGELWEDFFDCVLAERRWRDPRESLESVQHRLHRRKKAGAKK
jgi:hypothetical protein